MINFYHTIEKESAAEYKDRGSTFLAHAFPIATIEQFKKELKGLKEKHPKAAHHCYAYRFGLDNTNYRANDDGEPAGTAGKPILGQLDSRLLTDTAVVVVRYFGGTLLGVPGLINAYKMVSSFALQMTPIIQKPVLIQYDLNYDYTLVNEVMVLVKRINGVIILNEMQLFCRMVLGVPKAEEPIFLKKINDLHGIEWKVKMV